MAFAQTMIVMPVVLGNSLRGRPTSLLQPFGGHTSLLLATIRRVLAFELGRIHLLVARSPVAPLEVEQVQAAVAGEPVKIIPVEATGLMEELALLVEGVKLLDGDELLVIDPRAAFASSTIARAVLTGRREQSADIAVAPCAPRGMASVAITRAGAAMIGRAHRADGLWNTDLDLVELVRRGLRFWPTSTAVAIPATMECPAADLLPLEVSEVAELSGVALAPGDESYDAVFSRAATAAWNARWPTLKTTTSSAPRVLLSHIASADHGSTLGFRDLALGLAAIFPTTVVLPHASGSTRAQLIERGATVRAVPNRFYYCDEEASPGRWWPDDLAALTQVIDEERPDLVIVSAFIPPLTVAARLRGVPVIMIARSPIFDPDPYQRHQLTSRTAFTASNLVCVVSQHYADEIIRAYRPPPGRVRAVAYGVRVEPFAGERDPAVAARAREQLGLPASSTLILQAGMLIARKQPGLGIRAFSSLTRSLPTADLRLVFAGQGVGPDAAHVRDELVALAHSEGVGDRVLFLGQVAESRMPALYKACDIFMHCAHQEPSGRVATEAMASALPVVAVRSGATPLVVSGRTGYVVEPPGDADELARGLARLVNDPALRDQLGRAARAEAFAKASVAAHVDEMRTLVLELVKPRP
jgi:glycosyltransferase involved in cell wall biosynthesis